MAAGTDQDRTEPASPKKRQDARQKGQVALSREIPSVMVLLGAMTIFYFAGSWMFSILVELTGSVLNQCGQFELEAEAMNLFMWRIFRELLKMLIPLFGAAIVAGVIGNISQIGFMLTGKPLVPKFSKFNPINGIKRLFSLRSMVELIKALLKVLIVGGVAYLMLRGAMDQIPALVELDPMSILAFTGRVALKIGFYTCLVLVVLAGLDYVFQHWQHERDLRMSKQEVKDEYKQREGDPMVKSRIRSAQRQMAMQRMMESVPKATVIITNPTHLAIALKFERDMPAPMVVAKGAGHIAERIRKIAEEHGIPIVEQKPLARMLYKQVAIDHYIPVDLYHAVAELLAYVYRLKGFVRRQ
jgi:flagellar biosynthetic protein FlhB